MYEEEQKDIEEFELPGEDPQRGRKRGSETYRIFYKYRIVFGFLAGFLLLTAVIALAVPKKAKEPDPPQQESTAPAATEPPETTPSAEELERLAYERRVDAVIDSYAELGLVRTAGYVNMRSAPNVLDTTNIIGKLTDGAALDILGAEGDFFKVSSGKMTGYVSASYVTTGDEAKTQARDSIAERAIIGAQVLNVRSEPEKQAENVIGKARAGERYRLGEIRGDWAEITDFENGEGRAWINIADGNADLMLCLNEARRLDLREMALTQYDRLVVANTKGYINIRKTPKDEGISNICGKFPEHAGAELLETEESGGRTWYKIRSGKVTGYVAAEYCTTGAAAQEIALTSAVLTAYVNTEALNVRKGPSTDSKIWTQITKDQAYGVIEQLEGWVEIELDAGDGDEESDKAYVSTRDNNVEVRYGLPEAISYYPALEAKNMQASFRNRIVNYACQFIGNPYVWGGTSLTNGCDCSGFVQSVMAHYGIYLERTSRDQAKEGSRVTSDNMRPGDLVFYANSSGTVNHVGIYVGNGQIVNAASRRSGIKLLRWNYRTPVAIRDVIGSRTG